MKTDKQYAINVYLINLHSPDTLCGWGEGRTLELAQADALRMARLLDPNAYLSESGREVYFHARGTGLFGPHKSAMRPVIDDDAICDRNYRR